MDEDLVGYVLDSLEPKEQERIEELLDADPALQAEVARLRQLLLPLAADDSIEPPPGLAADTFQIIQQSRRNSTLSDTQREWAPSTTRLRPVDFIVAATILLMVSMLVLPAIARLRGDQQRIMCSDHLRRIGTALAMYVDQEGSLPFVDAHSAMNNAGSFAVQLKAKGLIDSGSSFICPSANNAVYLIPEPEQYAAALDNPARIANFRRYMSGSYGYRMGYEADGQYHGNDAASSRQALVSDRPPRVEEVRFVNSPNHDGRGQNVLYADGAVRWLPTRIYGQDDLFLNLKGQVGVGIGPNDTVIGASESTPYEPSNQ